MRAEQVNCTLQCIKNPYPMSSLDETRYLMAMTFIPGIGPRTAKKLISNLGSARSFFDVAYKLKLSGVHENDLKQSSLKSYLMRADDELKYNERNQVRIATFDDSDYPLRLKTCDDAPIVIYSKGNLNLNSNRMIAVVGTRKATSYGNRVCEEIVEELKLQNCSLISGLALGIDSYAHKAAQSRGIQNIGIVAHGLDRLYPANHRSLAAAMEENGGIVSDFPTGTRPDRENFPKRNRIIAGLADAVIVVEAAEKGGALITAELALSYNRDVFAVPGRMGDALSAGCNDLVRKNKAAILTKPSDLSYYMSWEKPKQRIAQTSLFSTMNEDEQLVASLIRNGSDHMDELMVQSNWTMNKLSTVLLQLEFNGMIKPLPGKRFQLCG
jgi:DNA processing protein